MVYITVFMGNHSNITCHIKCDHCITNTAATTQRKPLFITFGLRCCL